MNREISMEVTRIGGDPTDPIWHWLLLRGPHGKSFTWAQSRNEPAGYVGLVHLKEIVHEYIVADADFGTKALMAACCALESSDPIVIRRGIQVIAVLGGIREKKLISELFIHSDDSVRGDAKACAFELKQHARKNVK